jgi:hypothetical protein
MPNWNKWDSWDHYLDLQDWTTIETLISVTLKVDNIVEDIKLYQMVRPPGTNGQKPPTEAGFPVPTLGTADMGRPRRRWRDEEHLEL